MIHFSCPGCHAVHIVASQMANKAGQCPKCRVLFLIPGPGPVYMSTDANPPPSSATARPRHRPGPVIPPSDFGVHPIPRQ